MVQFSGFIHNRDIGQFNRMVGLNELKKMVFLKPLSTGDRQHDNKDEIGDQECGLHRQWMGSHTYIKALPQVIFNSQESADSGNIADLPMAEWHRFYDREVRRSSRTVSSSSQVVDLPRLNLTAPMPSSFGTPMALRTGERLIEPAWHAEPVDTAT